MIFETDADALEYLQSHTPSPEEEKTVDLTPLKEKLFDTPAELHPGHYEFEGKNGLKVSFDLVSSNSFDTCYSDLNGDEAIQGNWRPIYAILNLTIQSPHFSYSLKYPDSQRHAQINRIFWLPQLGSGDSELTHDYVNVVTKMIYLLAQDGFLSRPLDLLGFFHEVGHIETDPDLPHNQDTSTHIMGLPKKRTDKMTAYELQREEYANDWMMKNVRALFEDLGFPPETIADFCAHVQLKSYHEMIRKRFLEVLNG